MVSTFQTLLTSTNSKRYTGLTPDYWDSFSPSTKKAHSVQEEFERNEEGDKETGLTSPAEESGTDVKFYKEDNQRPFPKIPFESRHSPFIYTRRIEGILEPDKIDQILEGMWFRILLRRSGSKGFRLE